MVSDGTFSIHILIHRCNFNGTIHIHCVQFRIQFLQDFHPFSILKVSLDKPVLEFVVIPHLGSDFTESSDLENTGLIVVDQLGVSVVKDFGSRELHFRIIETDIPAGRTGGHYQQESNDKGKKLFHN